MTDGEKIERNGKIVFVPPRYGDEVVGGAESVVAESAHGLAARGWDVEILTTCAADHYTWANSYSPGTSTDGQVTVRRFPTVTQKRHKAKDRIAGMIERSETVRIQEQQLWMNDGMQVPELWHHILDHGDSYRALICAPYMFWTTFACSQIVPDRTILMPCLHDEPFARLEIFGPLFSGSQGLWFLSEPERDLAHDLFRLTDRSSVVGSGIAVPESYDPDGFRAEHNLERPFVYYAGRREPGKGWVELLGAFDEAVSQGVELDLVTSGVGNPEIPSSLKPRVHDVGFLSDSRRSDAMAAAAAYVQPSVMESFSRTILESWLAGTPVIGNAQGEVVSWHIERSGAGLTYRTRDELLEALRLVAEEPSAMARLAEPGRFYVLENYEPDRVLDRMEQTIIEWTNAPAAGPSEAGAPA